MGGALPIYYLLSFFYTVGYILSGPIPHQIIVSNWYRLNRGKAMGVVYVGVRHYRGAGRLRGETLTAHFGFHTALVVLGCSAISHVAGGAVCVEGQARAILASTRTAPRNHPGELSQQSRSFREYGEDVPFCCF